MTEMTGEDLLDQFSFSDSIKVKLHKYIDIIIDYNSKLNLVGKQSRTQIITDLLIPSIICTSLISKKHIIDIGSGSGILGIPIKLINEDVQLIICEKNLKKVAFINEVLLKLDINNVIIFYKRIENIDKNSLQNVEQLLIRGIKLVNIYDILLDKFPRGTDLIYFGAEADIEALPVRVTDAIPLPGNDSRKKPIFIYNLQLYS